MRFALPTFLLFCILLTSALAQTTLPAADLTANASLQNDFVTFDPHYKQEKADRIARTRALAKKVFSHEAAQYNTECSHEILFETMSLLVSSADFKFIDQRLADLEASISGAAKQSKPETPDPSGLWGACYKEWFLKVVASYDHLEKAADDHAAPVPLPRFLDRIITPEKLTDYFTNISVSDVAKTGIDHEREFNDMLATLMQMILRGRPQRYAVDPKLKAALLDLILHRFRNPATGWWGESYIRNGHTEFVDDLSITFHTVSYLQQCLNCADGKVPEMAKVIDTTLAVKDLDYPVGWLWKGERWNHNNMDIVTLFKDGWADASDTQRKAMAAEIGKMLHWCLTESLQPDGSFKPMIPDGSIEEGEDYGVAFLARIGFFDKSKRFWTDGDFPEAKEVRERLIAYIEKHQSTGGEGGDQYKSALEELGVTRESGRKQDRVP